MYILVLIVYAGGSGAARCVNGSCVWAPHAFALAAWRATSGHVREWPPAPAHAATPAPAPLLLLQPGTELELTLTFTPPESALLAAYLYLRNNLTILEGIFLMGEGAYPSFELAERKPNSTVPISFEVSECGGADGSGGVVRRTVVVRNTGRVNVRLREWRVAGRACQARGFRLQPCALLALAPNSSRALALAFAPDYTLALVGARLELRWERGRAHFALAAAAPARLLPHCTAAAPRPPWDPLLRPAAALLAAAAFALVLAAAALDAERLLRRARAARAPDPHLAPRAPLDLRTAAEPTSAPAPGHAPAPPRAPPARRRRAPRRTPPAPDPHAERRAFERWRAEMLRRPDDDDSRSSEDADSTSADAEPPLPHVEDLATSPLDNDEPFELQLDLPPEIDDDDDDYEPDRERDDDDERPSNSGDEDAVSSGSNASTPASDRGELEEHSEPEENETTANRDTPTDANDDRLQIPIEPPTKTPDFNNVSPHVTRPRREHGDTPRRSERSKMAGSPEVSHARRPSGKHGRKDKSTKRRNERVIVSAGSPTQGDVEPETEEATRVTTGNGGGCGAGSSNALRWGASWSSVVAARGALPPIGSDVRRTAPAPAPAPVPAPAPAPEPTPVSTPAPAPTDHSLFYFNGDGTELPWRATTLDRPYATHTTPTRDYLEEASGVSGVSGVGGGFDALGGGWGGAWAWGAAGAVRPPPGFGAPPRPPRAYDPFRSLASIWAPGAADWRLDAPDASLPAPPTATHSAPPAAADPANPANDER
ncbi:unnamed protein product [Parnassius apollo]|uniref:(apollo) hypothetical protein n=1 Tax=Parnassius apollo TaxID=110799 RepID=A0A8S3XLC6_PARAO|nr:unnamed protein product [Parnassius apollo]